MQRGIERRPAHRADARQTELFAVNEIRTAGPFVPSGTGPRARTLPPAIVLGFER